MARFPTRPAFKGRAFGIFLSAALLVTVLAVVPAAHAQVNHAPIVFAGQDKLVLLGTAGLQRLDSSGTLDIDNNASDLRYNWSVVTPTYSWLPIIPSGNPLGRIADFVAPTPQQAALYGYSITFRLTVTDPEGASSFDEVTYRFQEPPSASITVSAVLPDPNATDTDNSGTIEDDERYTIDAIRTRAGQAGHANNEWTIREGARLTLSSVWTPGRGGSVPPTLDYRWQRLAASPPRTEFNISASQADDQSITIDLPEGFDEGRLAVVHYRVTITDPNGVRANAVVRINVVDHQAPPSVTLELAGPTASVQDANGLDPDNPTLRYVVDPGQSVSLVATGADSDGGQARNLVHTWSGTGVVPSGANRPGTTSRATFTAPTTASNGQSFVVTVTVTDSTNRTGQDQILFIVVDNQPPVASAPAQIATSDGALGGTDRNGTVDVKGVGTDPDGDALSYRWIETDEDGDPLENPTVRLVNADQATVSFAAPQLSEGALKRIYLQLTVIDSWGVSDTDMTTVIILGVNEKPIADAGPDQVVDPGDRVQLNGAGSSDTDLNDRIVSWSWEYTGFVPSPPLDQLALTSSDRRLLSRFLPNNNGDLRNPLANANTPGPSFTAPRLGDRHSVQLTFTLTVTDTTGATGTDTVTITVASDFFSSYITGPEWCTNYSLGGPRTYPVDSNPKDGVADVCSLPSTRREAVARQNALTTLASLEPDEFLARVRLACRQLTDDYGDNPADLAADVCASGQLTPPPAPVSQAEATLFYSSYIDSPDWCTNYSLGGARTYAHDSSPKDGVADVCSLPYTRREAVARQNALETFTSPQAVFNSAVALACRRLGAAVFDGDSPADLARDICS